MNERRWARLESARTDLTEARPGDEITVETVLRSLSRRARCSPDSDPDSDFSLQGTVADPGQ